MKNVLLIGDSTMFGSSASSGYGAYVREHFSLYGKGEVFLPNDNCQDTRLTRAAFYELFEEYSGRLHEVDVIHWNNGLWDILHFCANPRPCVPLPNYVRLLGEIHDMLKNACPNACIIFATTTPVIEARSVEATTYRTNEEVDAYNASAIELMSKRGVVINDLCSFAREHLSTCRANDSVHFNEEGSALLANQVILAIDAVSK